MVPVSNTNTNIFTQKLGLQAQLTPIVMSSSISLEGDFTLYVRYKTLEMCTLITSHDSRAITISVSEVGGILRLSGSTPIEISFDCPMDDALIVTRLGNTLKVIVNGVEVASRTIPATTLRLDRIFAGTRTIIDTLRIIPIGYSDYASIPEGNGMILHSDGRINTMNSENRANCILDYDITSLEFKGWYDNSPHKRHLLSPNIGIKYTDHRVVEHDLMNGVNPFTCYHPEVNEPIVKDNGILKINHIRNVSGAVVGRSYVSANLGSEMNKPFPRNFSMHVGYYSELTSLYLLKAESSEDESVDISITPKDGWSVLSIIKRGCNIQVLRDKELITSVITNTPLRIDNGIISLFKNLVKGSFIEIVDYAVSKQVHDDLVDSWEPKETNPWFRLSFLEQEGNKWVREGNTYASGIVDEFELTGTGEVKDILL